MKVVRVAARASSHENLSAEARGEAEISATREISLEEDTLYVLDSFREHSERLISAALATSGKNVVFRVRGKLVTVLKFLLRGNPLERLTGYRDSVGVYVLDSSSREFETVYLSVGFVDQVQLLLSALPSALARLVSESLRLLKFSIVGLTGLFVNLAVLHYAASLYANFLSYEQAVACASITSFEASLTWNFALHEFWTFRDYRLDRNLAKLLLRWASFHASSVGSLVSQISFVTLLSGYLKFPLYASLIAGVAAGLLANYFLSKSIVWRDKLFSSTPH